jgi:lysophospholipase L1-like esterase
MMMAVNEANKISQPIYSGFVWKQGGADGGIRANAEDYYETLKQLITDLRKDLKNPKLPAIILGRASDEEIKKAGAPPANRKHLFTVYMAQNRVGKDIKDATTVHHGKLPCVPDGIHFNTEGQMTLGKMAATAVKALYKK